jgi:hypothetical protein
MEQKNELDITNVEIDKCGLSIKLSGGHYVFLCNSELVEFFESWAKPNGWVDELNIILENRRIAIDKRNKWYRF